MMKQILFVLFLFLKIINAIGQERYYFETPSKAKTQYEIDLNNSKIHHTDTVNFKIESLTLLKPQKSWHNKSLHLQTIDNDTIYASDNTGVNLYLFDMNGNPIRKIDLSKFDKHFKITNSEIYNDTLYLADKESLFLFKLTRSGDLITKTTLPFKFEDFQINNQGIYFISKHLDEKREKRILISLYDFSLDLQKLYFVTDKQNMTELRPKFFKGECDENLFSITECNQIYKLEKNKVSLYLQVNGGNYINSYANGIGFHMLEEAFSVKGESYYDLNKYYYPKEKLKDGIEFQSYGPNDLTILLNGSKAYQRTYVNITKMSNVQIPNILKMKWAEDHKYIKDELLELIKQVDENNKFVLVSYKVIENP